MRTRSFVRPFLVAGAAAALTLGFAQSPALAEPAAPQPTYYISLGDSLAAGYQPNTKTDEKISYTDDLYNTLKAADPGLQHIRLGCSGETTVTMANGGICNYPNATSQLDAATKFLQQHRGQVKYVTEDIGANDLLKCLKSSGSGTGSAGSSSLSASAGIPDLGCITQQVAAIGSNIRKMNSQLHTAGGSGVRYAGMNYYDPLLANWVKGGTGQVLATTTAAANNVFASAISAANTGAGWKTADVLHAFSNNDFGNSTNVPGIGTVPLNVARICTWTWMCTSYADIHANPTGHQQIAKAFLPELK